MSLDEEQKKQGLETKNIIAIMMVEVIGRPPEHLTETLNDIISKINEEKGVEVKEKKIHEPKPIKDQQDFYSSFAEVEFEAETIMHIAMLMFKYMPSHIEVLSPESFKITNNELNDTFNEITRRLHQYEEITRVIQNEKIILEKKLKDFLEGNKKE
ncbi:MAG: hypothetical protein KKF48_05075 [Nanoarchaeota archaeon]|nr:hypothetical protein [Nanoarchaeota archaeon]MBU1028390.1 hypothetical protein [Nanoarchaeota archaeon]